MPRNVGHPVPDGGGSCKADGTLWEGGIDDQTEVDPSILDGFELGHIPDDDAIMRLVTDLFPDCEAITYITPALIIELPRSDNAAFLRRLEDMPRSVEGAPFKLR